MSGDSVIRQQVYRQSIIDYALEDEFTNSNAISGLNSTFMSARSTAPSQITTQKHSYRTVTVAPSEPVNQFNASQLSSSSGDYDTQQPPISVLCEYRTNVQNKPEKKVPPKPPVRKSSLSNSEHTEPQKSNTLSVVPIKKPVSKVSAQGPETAPKPKRTDGSSRRQHVHTYSQVPSGNISAEIPSPSYSSGSTDDVTNIPPTVKQRSHTYVNGKIVSISRTQPLTSSNDVDVPAIQQSQHSVGIRKKENFTQIKNQFETQKTTSEEVKEHVPKRKFKHQLPTPQAESDVCQPDDGLVKAWAKATAFSFKPINLTEPTIERGAVTFDTQFLSKTTAMQKLTHGHLMVFLDESKAEPSKYPLTEEMIAYLFVALNKASSANLAEKLIAKHQKALVSQIRLITYLCSQQAGEKAQSTSATLRALHFNSTNVDFIKKYLPQKLPVQWAIKNKKPLYLDWLIANLTVEEIFTQDENDENVLFGLVRDMTFTGRPGVTRQQAMQLFEGTGNKEAFVKLLSLDLKAQYIKSFNNKHQSESVSTIAKKAGMEKELRKLHPHWK